MKDFVNLGGRVLPGQSNPRGYNPVSDAHSARAFIALWALVYVSNVDRLYTPTCRPTGRWCRIAKAAVLVVSGAATYLIIGGGCANLQSPQLKR